jgi:hypothetical protein
MTVKQEEAIVLRRPAKGIYKNFYVRIEGKDFPEVRQKLYNLGWEKSYADFDEPHYTSYEVYPPSGTGFLGGHTPYEKSKYVKQFKKVLIECGIETYYEDKFDWRDMI